MPPNSQGTDSDVSAQQALWDLTADQMGYSEALLLEEEAADHERMLAERLSATPAQSLTGIAAKLQATLRQGEWCEDCPDFPWPQIRSALEDLARIVQLDQHLYQDTQPLPGTDFPPKI